jgi:hypothetical protein
VAETCARSLYFLSRAILSTVSYCTRAESVLLALAFPAGFVNLGHGHNGSSPPPDPCAGLLFGCLAPPQTAIRRAHSASTRGQRAWRTFIPAALTVAVLTLAVTLAFGAEIWSAFLTSTKYTRAVVLEQGETGGTRSRAFSPCACGEAESRSPMQFKAR